MRETENTFLLLREPARRHMDAERAIGGDIRGRLQRSPSYFAPLGLVVLEATYGPMSLDNETAGLEVDVTIPLQALVHNSQLYVSNKVPKVNLGHALEYSHGAYSLVGVGYTGILRPGAKDS